MSAPAHDIVGISGVTPKWLSSFLTGIMQAVAFCGMTLAYSTVEEARPEHFCLSGALQILDLIDRFINSFIRSSIHPFTE